MILYGVVFGFVIDYLGVQSTLVVGTALSIIARMALVLAPSRPIVVMCLLTICPATTAMTNPVIKLAVRRYSSEAEREQSFRLIYIVINIACICSAIALGLSRLWYMLSCSWTPFGVHCDSLLGRLFPHIFSSYFRIALLSGVFAGFIQLAVAISLKNTPAVSQPANR